MTVTASRHPLCSFPQILRAVAGLLEHTFRTKTPRLDTLRLDVLRSLRSVVWSSSSHRKQRSDVLVPLHLLQTICTTTESRGIVNEKYVMQILPCIRGVMPKDLVHASASQSSPGGCHSALFLYNGSNFTRQTGEERYFKSVSLFD